MEFRLHSKLIFIFLGLLFSTSILAIADIPSTSITTNQVDNGRLYFNQGRYEDALVAWNSALDKYKLSEDRINQARVLHYKSEAYLAIGQNYKAISKLKLALDLVEESSANKLLASHIAGSLGTAYMLSNRSNEAHELLRKMLNQDQADGRLGSAAVTGNNLGNLLASQGNFEEAISVYKQVIVNAKSVENANLVAKGLTNISRVMVDSKQHKNALKQLEEASKHTNALPDSHEKAYLLISIGRLYTKLLRSDITHTSNKKIEKLASSTLKSAVSSAVTIGDKRAMSYTYGYLGELSEQKGHIKESMQYTRKALNSLRGIEAVDISYRWKWQQGRLLKSQGHIDQAINAYQRAVDDLQKVRHVLAAAGRINNKSDFRNEAGLLYMNLADLLLKNIANIKDNSNIENELKQVRATVEMLKGAELEDYFRDDCVAALKKKTKGIDNIGKRTAAIYPIIFQDRLEILLSLPDGMKHYTVPVSKDKLNNEINRFRSRLEKRTTHQYKRHAMNIYNWLILPLEKDLELQKVDTLVFIPDGAFRTVPLTALYDGKNFLVSRYAIATTPGLTLTDPQPLPRKNLKLLVAGLTESVQNFPPLPEVAAEVKKLDELYDATILQNNSFTKSNLETKLDEKNYSIVHIASHGKFKNDVRNSFLLTYDGKINMDLLENYMASTKYRKDPIELLTLSACQTAMGDDKAALGLGGIAVKAGARSALATLWYINDQASSQLIKDFYVNLKDSRISKAKALQTAQIAMIKDPRFKHPSYWAPFLLIGNWL